MNYIYYQPYRKNIEWNSCFIECICFLKCWSFDKAFRKIRRIIPNSLYFKSPTEYGFHDDEIRTVLDKYFVAQYCTFSENTIRVRDLKIKGTYIIGCHSEDEKYYHVTIFKDNILFDHSPKILSFYVDYIFEIEGYR